MVSSGKKSALLLGFGASFVLIGTIMAVLWPSLYFEQIKKRMILSESSLSFDMWKETPIPMFLEFYMFNITNVEDILAGRAEKIQVIEMGPYVYSELHIKTNITWNDNSTVTFYNQRWWHYRPDLSSGSPSDLVTTINPIVVTVAHMVRHRNAFIKGIVDGMLRGFHPNMFITANVSSWLFEGIEDKFLEAAQELPININIPFDKFGWFYSRNGSETFDGVFVMNTGAEDYSRLGNVELWRHSNQTDYRGECGMVRGSTGELWAPELGQEHLYLFAPDICTYITVNKDKPVTVQGINGVEYSANDSVFDNGYNYPHMACYCDEVRDAECLWAGALNVSACQHGAPAFISLPHFLYADPHYAGKIGGIHADEQKHNFKMSLEMYTGIPLAVSARLQISLFVRYISEIPLNNALPSDNTLVPMLWFTQDVSLSGPLAQSARFAATLRTAVPYAMYALTALGVLLIVAGIVILIRKLMKSPDTAAIIDSADEQSQ